jgi:hypothetical protein
VLTSCVAWMWLGRRSGDEPGLTREEVA